MQKASQRLNCWLKIASPLVKKNMCMLSTNNMNRLHKADACLNHAMSVNLAHCIPDTEGYTVLTTQPSVMWPKLLALIKRPHREERSVKSFYSHTIKGHATTLSSVVRDGKRYVWYYNPWGLDGDLSSGKYEIVEAPDKQTFDNVDAAQIEDIRKVLHFSDKFFISESDKIKLHGASVIQMLKKLCKIGPGEKKRAEQIFTKWDLWRSQGHTKLPQYHVMSIVALLKFATDSDHLIPIHPFDSMKADGPQQNDGIDSFLHKVTRSSGACVLWSKVYMQKVEKVMNDLLKYRVAVVPEADLLDTIKNTLTRSPIRKEDEHTPQLALARLMDSHGGQKDWKTILSLVYDMLPEFGERPPIRTTRIVAGENPYFHTAWHVEALWKLDLVVTYVKQSLVQNYGSIENGSGDFKPECVAGFIEVMYIVSSAETRARPGYTDSVGSIAAYIAKRRLHKFEEVELFINMVKMLIKCKQESPGDEVSTRVRQSYQMPASTRGDEENAKSFLQKHADTYGYGVSSTAEFREDRRKIARR